MATFAYRAVTDGGRTLRGVEEAATSDQVERALTARGLHLLELGPAPPPVPAGGRLRSRRRDAVEALRYLAALVEAEFPLDRALGTVERVVAREDVREALAAVRARVRAGDSLAAALADDPVFPDLAGPMAQAGERGGRLGAALTGLAEHLEREERLRSQLASSLAYPALLAVVGGATLLVMVLYVLPRFAEMLGDTGTALPLSTSIVLGAGDFLTHWWLLLLAVGVWGVVALGLWRASARGRLASDALLLRLPVIGRIRRQAAASRVGRTLSTLLGSGMAILTSLDIAADGVGDRAVARALRQAREEVRAGERLAPALGRGRSFPYVFLQMVDLGEQGGRLPAMLDRGALVAEAELERLLERLIRMVEPALILVFGGLVGLVALSLLQAIYGVSPGGL